MPQPKLYRLLERLNGRELPWLDKFLASPYFNSNAWPQRLWECLRAAHPRYDSLSKEQVFEQLCPGELFDGKFLNDRYSELSRLVEQFFIQQEFRQEAALQYPVRRAACYNRKRYRQFTRECHRQIGELEGQSPSIQNQGQLQGIYHSLYYGRQEAASPEVGEGEARQAMSCLDRHFILLKLKYMADLSARAGMYEEAHAIRLQEAVLAEAAIMAEQDHLTRLYLQLALLFKDGLSEEACRQLWLELQQQGEKLHREERAFFVGKLVALGHLGVNGGEKAYLLLLAEVLKYADQNGLLILDGQISDASFLNTCAVGTAAGEFDWILDFIDRHEAFLPVSSAAQAAILGKAAVLLNQEDYKGAHTLLQGINKRHPYYQIRLHSLLVRCLLGMHLESPKYYGPLLDSVAAFNRFIRRDKNLSAYKKEGYLNFGKAVKRIAALRSHHWRSARERDALRQWIDRLNPLMLRPWLEQRLS